MASVKPYGLLFFSCVIGVACAKSEVFKKASYVALTLFDIVMSVFDAVECYTR